MSSRNWQAAKSQKSVTTSPSIVVIQGAYEFLCADGQQSIETKYDPDPNPFSFFSSTIQVFVTDPPVEDWLRLQQLIAQWRVERGAMSSITEAAMCPAYQSILGVGPAAVPLLLGQLESEGEEPDQWFWALKAITGTDPVRDEDRGDYVAMARSWLQWGQTQGYAW